MGVKFFGQFLVERGEIQADELRSALGLMKRENLSDDRCLDAIGEFLNILAGNAISVLEEGLGVWHRSAAFR